jgi:hypothetical protein
MAAGEYVADGKWNEERQDWDWGPSRPADEAPVQEVPPPPQSCGNCRFFCGGKDPGKGKHYRGDCRVVAPHPAHGFAEVWSSSWCGDWQAK